MKNPKNKNQECECSLDVSQADCVFHYKKRLAENYSYNAQASEDCPICGIWSPSHEHKKGELPERPRQKEQVKKIPSQPVEKVCPKCKCHYTTEEHECLEFLKPREELEARELLSEWKARKGDFVIRIGGIDKRTDLSINQLLAAQDLISRAEERERCLSFLPAEAYIDKINTPDYVMTVDDVVTMVGAYVCIKNNF